jgi:hypothetical protein
VVIKLLVNLLFGNTLIKLRKVKEIGQDESMLHVSQGGRLDVTATREIASSDVSLPELEANVIFS